MTPGGTQIDLLTGDMNRNGQSDMTPPGMASTAGVELPPAVKTALALAVQPAYRQSIEGGGEGGDDDDANTMARARRRGSKAALRGDASGGDDLAAAPRLPSRYNSSSHTNLHGLANSADAYEATSLDQEEEEDKEERIKREYNSKKQLEQYNASQRLVAPVGSYSTDHQSFLRELHKAEVAGASYIYQYKRNVFQERKKKTC